MRSPCTSPRSISAKSSRWVAVEQLGQLHAQPGEIVDVEKAAVVDLLRRDPPIGDAVGLGFEQPVQAPKLSGWPGRPVKRRSAASIAAATAGSPGAVGQAAFQLGRALRARRRRRASHRGEIAADRASNAPPAGENRRIGARRDRKAMIVIPGAEAPSAGSKRSVISPVRGSPRIARRAPAAAPGLRDRRAAHPS